MCVCVCVFCNMWGFFGNYVIVLVICVLVFTVFLIVCIVFLYCFVYLDFLICFVCTGVRTTATG